MLELFVFGFGAPADYMLMVMRVAVGVFFAISGFHKLFYRDRHARLVKTLEACGIPWLGCMQWFVPGVEFLAGLGLAAGFLTPLSSAGLLAICLVAICTDGLDRIKAWKPIDKADVLDDVLYLQETLYALMLVSFIIVGPGALSVDAFLLSLL